MPLLTINPVADAPDSVVSTTAKFQGQVWQGYGPAARLQSDDVVFPDPVVARFVDGGWDVTPALTVLPAGFYWRVTVSGGRFERTLQLNVVLPAGAGPFTLDELVPVDPKTSIPAADAVAAWVAAVGQVTAQATIATDAAVDAEQARLGALGYRTESKDARDESVAARNTAQGAATAAGTAAGTATGAASTATSKAAEAVTAAAGAGSAASAAVAPVATDLANLKTDLPNTYGTKNEVAAKLSSTTFSLLSRDASAGTTDRARSGARSLIAYDDAAQVVELWANSTAWTPPENIVVSNGYAYKGANGAGANRGHEIAVGETVLITTSLLVVAAGGGAGLVLAGVSLAAANTAPSAGDLRAIGIESNTGKVVSWALGFGNPEYITTTALAAGEYTVSIAVGLTDIGFTINNADHTVEYRRVFARPSGIHNLMVWNTDPRGTSGIGVGPLVAKKAVAATPKPAVKRTGPTTVYGASGSGIGLNAQRIVAPKTYDSRLPTPLVIFCHGLGGDATAPFTGVAKNFETALVNAGYIFAASDGYSATHFGMEAAVQEYLRLYRNCRDSFNISRVVLIGESMGGLVSLNILGRRLIPNVAAYVGVYPQTSLEVAYASNTGWASGIRSNYGIAADGSDYAVKTAGYSPILRAPEDYWGVPMRFYASPADTLVSKAANTDAFAARVLPVVPEAGVVSTTGDHGDASNFNGTQQADLLAFLARSIGSY